MDKDVDVKVVEAFNKALDKGKSDDDIKFELIKAGAKFSTINTIFNKLMINCGKRLTKEARDAIVNTACSGKDCSVEEIFDGVVESIVAESDTITAKSAMSLIRSWCKANGVECFKKATGGKGRSSFMVHFGNFLVANPTANPEEVANYIDTQPDRGEDKEVSENVIRSKSHYLSIGDVANRIASA